MSVWEELAVTMALAALAEPLLRRMKKRWRRMRVSRTVAMLTRGDSARIRCAARFRNTGGARHRARLTVKAEGVFLTIADGTNATPRPGMLLTGVEVVAERSMLVCTVAGRQLEILLPADEDRLLRAVTARLSDCSDKHYATAGAISRSASDTASVRHKS